QVASVLDEAARLATERGAPAVAAELTEQAFRLTPPDERRECHRRALAAVRAQRAAGEWTRARAMVTDLLAEADIGQLRAEALVLLAEFEGLHRSVELLEGALGHARAALELADELDDDTLRVRALELLTFFGCAVGDTDAPAYAARARAIAAAGGDPELMKAATNALAAVLEE